MLKPKLFDNEWWPLNPACALYCWLMFSTRWIQFWPRPRCLILLVGSARIELAIFAMSRQRHDP